MQSNEINELAAALSKAQGAIKVAVKGAENPFFRSHYADLPAIYEACRAALSTNGLAVTQATQFEGEAMWLETTLMHSSGQWLMSRYPVRPVKNDPQGMGSALTYARRYALSALVGVVSDDGSDDDGEAASGRPVQAQKPRDTPPDGPSPTHAATMWAKQAQDELGTFKTDAELGAWHKKNANTVARLRDVNEAAHKRLVEAIANRTAELSPLNA